MAVTVETLTTADDFLKEHYASKDVHEQMIMNTIFLKKINSSGDFIDPTGKYAVHPIWMELPQGTGARPEGGSLPEAQNVGSERAIVRLKYNYQTIRLSGQLIEASAKALGSFVNELKFQVKAGTSAVKKDYNRQLQGTGKGVLTTVESGVGASPDQVFIAASVKHLRVGMQVEFYSAAGVARSVNTFKPKITAITTSTRSVTVDQDIAAGGSIVATGDEIFRFGNRNNEVVGIQEYVDNSANDNGGSSATVLDISSTTNPNWASVVTKATASGTAPLTLALLDTLTTEVEQQNGQLPDVLLTTYKGRNKLKNLLVADKRFVNTMELDGGAKVLEHDGIAVLPDDQAAANKWYALSMGDLVLHDQTGFKWDDRDGSIWKRVPGKDEYEAVLYSYSNLGVYRRNTHGVLINVEE